MVARKPKSELIRSSKTFKDYVMKIKYSYVMNGKKPPTIRQITEMIAKKLNKEEKSKNEFSFF